MLLWRNPETIPTAIGMLQGKLVYRPPVSDADVVKLANTRGLGPRAARLVGSSPSIGTRH